MKLFFSPTSPYVRKCMVTAHELGLVERIALLPSQAHPVNRDANLVSTNPLGKVPTLVTDAGEALGQSLAIIEYLEEVHPQPPLLPAGAVDRARVRALAQAIACEIHPLNNLRVLKYLVRELKVDEAAKDQWYRHWVRVGLEAFERELAQGPQAAFCFGDTPTLADCCLVPQIFNARRLDTDLTGLPRTMAAFDACMALPAFQQAQPSACPDAEG